VCSTRISAGSFIFKEEADMKKTLLREFIHPKSEEAHLGRSWDSLLYRYHPHSPTWPTWGPLPIGETDFGNPMTKERAIAALSIATRAPQDAITVVSKSDPGLPFWWSRSTREAYMSGPFWADLIGDDGDPSYTFWGALAQAHEGDLRERLGDKFDRISALMDECILDEAVPTLCAQLGFPTGKSSSQHLAHVLEEHFLKWQRRILTYWASYEMLGDAVGKAELEPCMRLHPAMFPIGGRDNIVLIA
jgi:hypothetical protein